jgi:UDP-N-acetyl-D-mannosaminuronic acid dehydrogenase
MRLASSQKLTGILGLGHVGLTLAAHLLRKGVRIVGIENDPIRVEAISNHRFDIFEPGLAEIFLKATPEEFQINNCNLDMLDTLFVCVGTSKPDPGKPEANLFEKAVLDASKYLKKSGTLFLRSTVSLGVTNRISQRLKAISRDDLVVAFTPERTAEGAALFELEKLPQIVGADSKLALSRAVGELQALGFEVIAADSTKTAEFSKLMCNVWRDTTFAFSNEMAIIGDGLGVDTHAAISISNFNYPRAQIPTPGPVLGPCLSKDTYILHDGIDFIHNPLTLAARNMNEIFEEHIYH